MGRMDSRHEMMFEKDDIREQTNVLKRLIVQALIDHDITYAEFSKRFCNYQQKRGFSKDKILQSRNNLMGVLVTNKNITFDKFVEVYRDVLGLNLIGITLTLKDENDKVSKVHTDTLTY